jgi:hypothetical protein
MSEDKYTHIGGNTTTEIVFHVPYRFTFHYDDGTRTVFENINKFKAAKTGCYILCAPNDVVHVVPPKHRYLTEEPMEVVDAL